MFFEVFWDIVFFRCKEDFDEVVIFFIELLEGWMFFFVGDFIVIDFFEVFVNGFGIFFFSILEEVCFGWWKDWFEEFVLVILEVELDMFGRWDGGGIGWFCGFFCW